MVEYNIMQVLSTLIATHRFQIMENLYNKSNLESLYIGVGSGLEISY